MPLEHIVIHMRLKKHCNLFFFFLGRRMKFIEANSTYNIKLIQKKSSSISKHSLANKRTHPLKILEIKLNSTDLKTLDDPIFFALNSFYGTQHIQPHFNQLKMKDLICNYCDLSLAHAFKHRFLLALTHPSQLGQVWPSYSGLLTFRVESSFRAFKPNNHVPPNHSSKMSYVWQETCSIPSLFLVHLTGHCN